MAMLVMALIGTVALVLVGVLFQALWRVRAERDAAHARAERLDTEMRVRIMIEANRREAELRRLRADYEDLEREMKKRHAKDMEKSAQRHREWMMKLEGVRNNR